MLIPFALQLVCFLLIYEDAPLSLLKTKNTKKICASLNRIGRINKGKDDLISEQEIEEYLWQEEEREKIKKSASMLDMCRYESLRVPSVVFIVFCFLANMVYFAHSSIISAMGFNPTLNQVLMSIAQFLSLPLILFVFSRLSRKKSIIWFAFLGAAFSLISVFVKVPPACESCTAVFVEMGLAMLTRFCIISSLSLIYIMMGEFYPASISELAIGILGLVSSSGSFLGVIIFTSTQELAINPFLLIGSMLFCVGLALLKAPETINSEPSDQIQEVEDLEAKIKGE